MPKWQECYTLPKECPKWRRTCARFIGFAPQFYVFTHTYIYIYMYIYICICIYIYMPKPVGSPLVEHENSNQKLCRSSCQRKRSSLFFLMAPVTSFFSVLKQSRGAMFSTLLVRSLRNCARAFITVARPGFWCKAAAAITSTVFLCDVLLNLPCLFWHRKVATSLATPSM